MSLHGPRALASRPFDVADVDPPDFFEVVADHLERIRDAEGAEAGPTANGHDYSGCFVTSRAGVIQNF